jgi:Ca2+-binding RTX toxin-like protein
MEGAMMHTSLARRRSGSFAAALLVLASMPGAADAALVGSQTQVAVGIGPSAIGTLDNPDPLGDPIVAVANYDDDTVSFVQSDGSGGFVVTTEPVGDGPRGIAIDDPQILGDPTRVVTANADADSISLLTGTRTGFSRTDIAVGDDPRAIALRDAGGVNCPNILVGNFGDDTVWLMTADSSCDYAHTEVAVGDGPTAVAIQDPDTLGDPSAAVANFNDSTVSLLFDIELEGGVTQILVATFAVGAGPAGIALADLDGDGDHDVAVANSADDSVTLLLNDGSGAFDDVTFKVGTEPRGIAVGDLDGVNDPEIFVANFGDNTVTALTSNGSGGYEPSTFDVGLGPVAVAVNDANILDPGFDFVVADSLSNTISLMSVQAEAPNEAPTAVDDAYATAAGTPLSVAAPGVLANDTDPDEDALTAALASGPAHGTVSLASDGSFSYTPAEDFSGLDAFTYRASDGELLSDPATVRITVAASCGGRTPTIVGTAGPDKLVGTAGDDVIWGLGGNDKLIGQGGNDVLCGGGGNDELNGNSGNDRLLGGSGNDVLRGDIGNDSLDGGPGTADACHGDKGTDTALNCEKVTGIP